MADDRRFIENHLPIKTISAEASREKSVRKGHISTLHRWWARRPLVACRAAVYAALVPADQFAPVNGPEEKRESLARANAAKFLQRLCRREVTREDLEKAAAHVREANGGKAPRVLDQFAGGGSIPSKQPGLTARWTPLELATHMI